MRVFVVDDSSFVRKALARVLGGVQGVHLVGEAGSGSEALARLEAARPDVVTLDVDMPGMDGLATLRQMLRLRPELRVIMLSAHTQDGAATTLEALSLGAVDFIDKSRVNVVDFGHLRAELVAKLEIWSAGASTKARQAAPASVRPASPQVPSFEVGRFELCVVGASTGGPPAVQALVEALPARFRVPIVVAQHMPVGFTAAFARRLDGLSPLRVVEAHAGLRLGPGVIAIAPAGQQLRVGADRQVILTPDRGDHAHAPSVDVTMTSAAATFGARVLGILLTGMGTDGAQGLADIRAAGGVTVAENEASCVVYGMPRAAVERGAVVHELGLPQIVELLQRAGGPQGASV